MSLTDGVLARQAEMAQGLARRLLREHDLRAVVLGAANVLAIRMVGAAIAYASMVLLARWLGAFDFGIYAYVWVWIQILGVVLALGFESSALRFIPDYAARNALALLKGFLRQSYGVAAGIGLAGAVVAAGLVFAAQAFVESHYFLPLLVGAISVPLFAVLGQHEVTARALGWVHLAYLPGYILRPLILIGIVGVLAFAGVHPDAVDALWGVAAACAFAAVLQGALILRRLAPMLGALPPAYLGSQWRAVSFAFCLIDGFHIVLDNSDVLMVGRLMDPQAVAVYFAAVRTGSLIAFIYFAVAALAVPRFSKIHITGTRAEMQRFVSGVIQMMFWPSLTAAASLVAIGPFVLSLFGADFSGGYPALLVILFGLVARAATGPVEYLLNMTGHHKDTVWVYGATVAATIAMNLLLIPRFGMVGAAIAAAASIAGANLWLYVLVRRRLGLNAFILARSKLSPSRN
jgi:O-antigen/teichoic acid export membrane protein